MADGEVSPGINVGGPDQEAAKWTTEEILADLGKASDAIKKAAKAFWASNPSNPLITPSQVAYVLSWLATHIDGFEDKVESWAQKQGIDG